MEAIIEKRKAEGMGACFGDDGLVTFRVWAPHAEKVFVVGTFNDWEKTDFELEPEDNGFWCGTTDQAQEGDAYKYLIHNGGALFERNDPYAVEVTQSNGNSVIRKLDFDWSTDTFEIADWNRLVIYELHVGTFNRKEKGKVGTFKGVIEKLDYLRDLGINAIELLPIAEFAGGVSWGYNPAHLFAVEGDYGGPEGLRELVRECHARNIAVIIDVVYNHFGPSDLDLWQFDGWHEEGKGGIYFYNDYRSTTPWGDTRPDYGRPEVRQYIMDNAFFWIEKYNCDGLRMDATSYIRFEGGGIGMDTEINEGNILMRDINAALSEKHPRVITIAEDLKGHHKVTDAIDANGLGYGSQWDMGFVHPVREVLTQTTDEGRDLQKIVDALLYRYSDDAFKRVVYTESHDEVANGKARVPEEIQPGDAESEFAKKRALLGIALTLTAPGIPMLFQGQEFMEDEYFKDDEPLDWEKLTKFKGIQRLVADMVKLRTGAYHGAAGLTGQFTQIIHFNKDTGVLAYIRNTAEDGEEAVLVVLNLKNKEYHDYGIGIDEHKTWRLRINSAWRGYDNQFSEEQTQEMAKQSESTDGQEFTGKINLRSYSLQIFS